MQLITHKKTFQQSNEMKLSIRFDHKVIANIAYIQLNLAENTSDKETQIQQASKLNVVHTNSLYMMFLYTMPAEIQASLYCFMKIGQTKYLNYKKQNTNFKRLSTKAWEHLIW